MGPEKKDTYVARTTTVEETLHNMDNMKCYPNVCSINGVQSGHVGRDGSYTQAQHQG